MVFHTGAGYDMYTDVHLHMYNICKSKRLVNIFGGYACLLSHIQGIHWQDSSPVLETENF